MPTFHLTRDIDNRLCGVTEADNRAYTRFAARVQGVTREESLKVSWVEPRSGKYHRRHFVMLTAVFDNQEVWEKDNHFRKWCEVGAGYAELVPGMDGQPVAMPLSIDYDTLDQIDFEPIHNAVFAFLRTEHALKFLWPHLPWQKAYAVLDTILRDFE